MIGHKEGFVLPEPQTAGSCQRPSHLSPKLSRDPRRTYPAPFRRFPASLRAWSLLLVIQIFLGDWAVGIASGQDWAEDILNKVKRAQKLIQGERPCGAKIEVKGEAWRLLMAGIEGRIVRALPNGTERGVTLHLIRIDPHQISVRVLLSKDLGTDSATAESYAKRSDALVVSNAGYFGKSLRPLGLLVADGKLRNAFIGRRGRQSDVLYEGVFTIKNGHPGIQRNQDYRPAGEELAVQAGPLLIADGKATSSLKGLRDAKRLDGRTAVTLDAEGRIILWVTASHLSGMNWCELRDVMLQYGEWGNGGSAKSGEKNAIRWALNLDGGSSAQLFVRQTGQGRPLNVSGGPIPAALGFFHR